MVYQSVTTIIQRSMLELGLGIPSGTVSLTHSDPNVVQLFGLLFSVAQDLRRRREWRALLKEHSFVTTSSNTYALPADFVRMVDQSGWNRTQDRVLHNASEQLWQYLKATSSGQVMTAIFRIGDGFTAAGNIELWPQPPTSGETIAFRYLSSYAVKSSGSSTPDQATPGVATDVVCFDVELVIRALKLAWKREKGFDTSASQAEFDAALDEVMREDVAMAPVLNVSPYGDRARLIDEWNLPETGFGI